MNQIPKVKNFIPIFEVTDENFEAMWPAMRSAIQKASFIALDCELSGLGDRRKLNCREVDIRYKNTSDIAREYSIVSLGLSCFSCQSFSSFKLDRENGKENMVKSHNQLVQTFNIYTLCSPTYTVEHASLKFLISHGFDFNKQYSHGLHYNRGEQKQGQNGDQPIIRDVFSAILKNKKPIILHNGFIDLIFLYESFYAELPKKSETFAADLCEMFPYGIYDTKYIAEYHETLPATYLEYVFKKSQLENEARCKKGDWHVNLSFPPYPPEIHGLKWYPYGQVHDYVKENDTDLRCLCESYMYHGWCSKGHNCEKSHNIDRIVRELEYGRKRKRKLGNLTMTSIADIINTKLQKIKVNEKCEKRSRTRLRKRANTYQKDNALNDFTKHFNSTSNGNDSCSSSLNGDILLFDNGNEHSDDGNEHSTINLMEINTENEFKSNLIFFEDKSQISKKLTTENGEKSNPKSPTSDHLENKAIMDNKTEKMDTDYTKEENKQNGKESKKQEICSGHRAGFDAFMTGYIFACNVTSLSNDVGFSFDSAKSMNMENLVSRVYLISKGFPFLIRNNTYATTSPGHDRIIKVIREDS